MGCDKIMEILRERGLMDPVPYAYGPGESDTELRELLNRGDNPDDRCGSNE